MSRCRKRGWSIAVSSPTAGHLEKGTGATDLLTAGGRVTGVRARRRRERLVIHSQLVIAPDGRGSTVRRRAGLAPGDLGSPIDVLWWRLPKGAQGGPTPGYLRDRQIGLTIDRGDYFQCGSIVPKGSFHAIKEQGSRPSARASCARRRSSSAIQELTDWDQVRLLSVQINRLERWYQPGLLYIGDAAPRDVPAGGCGGQLRDPGRGRGRESDRVEAARRWSRDRGSRARAEGGGTGPRR